MGGEWVESSFGDLVEIEHGFAFKGEYFRDEPPGDILLTPGNFAIGGGFKPNKFKYYDGPVPDEFVLHEGDLLVTMTDLSKESDTLGYPAFVPAPSKTRRYLHNQRLGKVVAKDKAPVDLRYMHYLMCTRAYRHEVLASATGTTVKHTSPERIKRFRFLRPPPPEQRAIAHILGTLDDKIELNRKMNEMLEAIARAIFKSWFVDFDPVRGKAEGRDPGLPKEIAALFPASFQDSELGEIPNGWRILPLGSWCSVFTDGSHFSPKPDALGPKVIATVKDMGEYDFRWDQLKHISDQDFKMLLANGCTAARGDILFSKDGSVGKVIYFDYDEELALLSSIAILRPAQQSYGPYLWACLRQPNTRSTILDGFVSGSALPRVVLKDLRLLPIVQPPENLLESYAITVLPMIKRICSNQVQFRTLAALRDVLLPKLISGELRTTDTERFIGAKG